MLQSSRPIVNLLQRHVNILQFLSCMHGKSHVHPHSRQCFEVFVLLGCYAALIGRSLPMFRDTLSAPFSRVWNMIAETSVATNLHSVTSQNSEDHIYTEVEAWNHILVFCLACLLPQIVNSWYSRTKKSGGKNTANMWHVSLCLQIAPYCDISAYLAGRRGLKTMPRPNGTSSCSLIACKYRLYHFMLPIASNVHAFRMSRILYHKIIDRTSQLAFNAEAASIWASRHKDEDINYFKKTLSNITTTSLGQKEWDECTMQQTLGK